MMIYRSDMENVIEIKTIQDTLKVNARLLALVPDLEKGKKFECTIKQHRERRSLDANAYFHVLVDKIAKALNKGADEMKVELNLEYGTPAEADGKQIIIALPKKAKASDYYPYAKWIANFFAKNGDEYSQYLLYEQTHKLNTAQMARLIDGVVQEAEQLNIETRSPEEILDMISLWGTQK